MVKGLKEDREKLQQSVALWADIPDMSFEVLMDRQPGLSSIVGDHRQQQQQAGTAADVSSRLHFSLNDLRQMAGGVKKSAEEAMLQRYGEHEDNLLGFMARKGSSEAVSFLLTNPTAKDMVAEYGLMLMSGDKGTPIELIQAQGPAMARQKEEFLDLVYETIPSRSKAINLFKVRTSF